MSRKTGRASVHKLPMGDEAMDKPKKKAFNLRFVLVEDRGAEIARNLAKREIQNVLARNGAISDNLEEVLSKYITGEMCNDQKG